MECLSTNYVGTKCKLEFRCNKCSHQWEAKADNILRGSWCRECFFVKFHEKKRNKNGFSEFKTLVESKGGQCAAQKEDYKNLRSKLNYICDKGHKRSTTLNEMRRHWCNECSRIKSGKNKSLGNEGLLECKRYAESHGGTFYLQNIKIITNY